MRKESSKIEAKNIPAAEKEKSESHEAPEAARERMLAEAEGQVAKLETDGKTGLAGAEKRAAEEGLTINLEDKNELAKVDHEAEDARNELTDEIQDNEAIGDNGKEALRKKYGAFAKESSQFYRKLGKGENTLDHMKTGRARSQEGAEAYKTRFEQYKSEVENLRAEIEEIKSSIINRILKFARLNELRKDVENKEIELTSMEEVLSQKRELVEAFDYMISEEESLASLMEEAQKENAEFDEKKRVEFLEDERRRSVETLAKEKGVFFVHGIVNHKSWGGENEVLDASQLTWSEKLDLVIGLEPTLSSSTLQPGTEQQTHGRRGVIFSRGRALGGSRNDMQSLARGLRERVFEDSMKSTASINEAIGSEHSRQGGYNEIILEKPEVAAVYINLCSNGDPDIPQLKEEGDGRFTIDGNLFDSWECIREAQKRQLGVVIFTEENRAFRIYDADNEAKTFSITPELRPEDIANNPSAYGDGYAGQQKKRAAVMRVFDKVAHLIPEEERDLYDNAA